MKIIGRAFTEDNFGHAVVVYLLNDRINILQIFNEKENQFAYSHICNNKEFINIKFMRPPVIVVEVSLMSIVKRVFLENYYLFCLTKNLLVLKILILRDKIRRLVVPYDKPLLLNFLFTNLEF